ncbi:MAG: hypothetical protein PWP23_49 [Candidatus Sumerlaeota bacterium]|nr:hypothetical protein [Candidatus Sumerlaeota bacterium]
MKPRLAILFSLLVLVPLAGLSWLGVRLAASEREAVDRRFEQVLETRLRDVDALISAHLETVEARLSEAARMSAGDPASLADAPAPARQFFLIDADGKLVHPAASGAQGSLSTEERAFLGRIQGIVINRDLWHASRTNGAEGKDADSGWYDWYEGRGLNLAFWLRRPDGSVAAFEINRPRLTADLIAALPDTPGKSTGAAERIRLTDEKGDVVYQWGALEPGEDAEPEARIALAAPLASWHLEVYLPSGTPAGFGSRFPLLAGIAAAAIALIALAFVLYREYRRDLNEAERRLTFVNQVSHELKTPLTNIRLYAELLEENLPDEAEDERRYVGVLVGESRRLSRLIDNVLAFSRQRQEKLRLHPAPGCIDDTIREVIEQFAPALGEAGIVVETNLDAAATFPFDRDAVAQILGNLIGNVEKYAASGGWMRVASEIRDGVVCVRVEDHGPGVPPAHRSRIFRPFHRVDDSLTARSTGTGIGLSIARALARLHGGDLQLTASSTGSTFEFHLPLGGR